MTANRCKTIYRFSRDSPPEHPMPQTSHTPHLTLSPSRERHEYEQARS